VDHHEAAAADAGELGLDHVERELDGRRGVDGVAALLQRLGPGLGGQRLFTVTTPCRNAFPAQLGGVPLAVSGNDMAGTPGVSSSESAQSGGATSRDTASRTRQKRQHFEVSISILPDLTGNKWLMASLFLEAGVQLMECVNLRVHDLFTETGRSDTPPQGWLTCVGGGRVRIGSKEALDIARGPV
jgi:hypothetical protein